MGPGAWQGNLLLASPRGLGSGAPGDLTGELTHSPGVTGTNNSKASGGQQESSSRALGDSEEGKIRRGRTLLCLFPADLPQPPALSLAHRKH